MSLQLLPLGTEWVLGVWRRPGRPGLWMGRWSGVTVLWVFTEEAARAGHRPGIVHRSAADAARPAGRLQPRQGRGPDPLGSGQR